MEYIFLVIAIIVAGATGAAFNEGDTDGIATACGIIAVLCGLAAAVTITMSSKADGANDTKQEVKHYLLYQNKIEMKWRNTPDGPESYYVPKDTALTDLLNYLNKEVTK